ncbi:MAG TPA: PEP/pyruvate-binding domain-containing protein [Vicinamibacterales bacterium]|jgi:pyruvate,water dikinase
MRSPLNTLDGVTAADRSVVGGKAYNCARLKQAGFPVPDGFVIAADAGDDQIAGLADHPWLAGIPSGQLFAVRSSGLAEDSAADSFAGIHETFLNVDRAGLVDAVRRCRDSARSEPARAYRAARRVADGDAGIAVLVQCMVAAVRSGVTFTINPVTGADELVIEWVDGLGEALVSGRVTPDEQRLPKSDPSELAKLAVRIEAFYAAPQDIEWCFDGRQYWIVQSRPVTARAGAPAAPVESAPARDLEWTRANLAEVLPEQLSPQALDVYCDLLNRGQQVFFGRFLAPESELGPVIKPFNGRLYFNLSQLRHVAMVAGVNFADSLRSLGHPEAIHPDDETAAKRPLIAMVRALPDAARLATNALRLKHVFHGHEALSRDALARFTSVDPAALSDAEIWKKIREWREGADDAIPAVLAMTSVQFREDAIRKICRRIDMPFEELVYPQLAAGERSVSSQQAFDLVALAAVARQDPRAAQYLSSSDGTFADFRRELAGTDFLKKLDAFLATYGHRGPYESDWAIPRLSENPAPVLFAIREQLHAEPQDPAAVAAKQAADAAAAWRAFESHLSWWQKPILRPRTRMLIRQLKQQYLYRERIRFDLTRVVAALRRWHLTLADRFVERGWLKERDDYFLLLFAEVGRAAADPACGPELGAIAARRAAQLAAERHLAMPLFMRESELPSLLRAGAAGDGASADELSGLCVSPGAVEGEVVVLRDPSEFAKMKRGAVLVTTATDPAWTPMFTLASGVVVEVGGMLSHASTIAREYGLPALANVKNATKILRTGDRVRLDASAGVVRRLAAGAALVSVSAGPS